MSEAVLVLDMTRDSIAPGARAVDYFRNGGLLHHVVCHRLTPEVRS